ncbi:glycosyltransferase, partial [bacterium]|nr:glycosyltransferase [bacterium]
ETPDSQEVIFSYVGRVVPLKQPEVLLEIISELSQQSDLTPLLFLAGRVTDEYRKELQERAHALGIGSQLHLTGSLSPAEIGALYHRSTLYLSASQHEGRSNAVLEALAAGLPACLSDIPGHRELVSDGEQGILFSSDNPTEAAQRIHHLLKDTKTRQKLKTNAQQSVSHLTWETHAAAFQKLYQQALRRK